MDNRALARTLHEIADLLEIKGENPFRIRSYRVAAESLENHGQEVSDLLARGLKLGSIPGVGEGIAAKLRELCDDGTCAYHQELLLQVPRTLLELLRLPGLGPKGVSLVWSKLGVRSAADLEAAIGDGRFRTLPGMKEKKEARILRGLQERKRGSQRILLPEAEAVVQRLTGFLLERGASQVVAVGSFRRRRETVGDLDLIVVGGDAEALSAAFTSHPDVKEVLGHGAAKSSVVLHSGLQVDFRPFLVESLGAGLQYFTGSKAHNVALRERAVKRGLKLNEYGLFGAASGDKLAGASEDEIYAALGLPFIPPELREDRGEIEAAEAGTLPRLLEAADIQGDLHCHTVESDGRDSLEDMVAAAQKRGLRYLALTEHTRAIPSRTNDRGMDETRALAHVERIRTYQAKVPGIRLLAGVEVCILADGRLDLADAVLAQLDVVVGSLHNSFEQPREETTARLLRAFTNPHLDIWGHPLGRLITRRDPVACDTDAVFEAAARAGIALEVNSQPDRLDLPDHLIRPARDKGVRFVVSTDSHATREFENLAYGVGQARRGWLTPEDVLNTRDAEHFLGALRQA